MINSSTLKPCKNTQIHMRIEGDWSQKLGVERSLFLILFLYVILTLATSSNFVKVSGNHKIKTQLSVTK